jgi:DHA1 family multidrug resistance protein-like MFS transporter
LAFAPLSELYERKWPLTGACFIFTCFMFAAATAKDFQTLMKSPLYLARSAASAASIT